MITRLAIELFGSFRLISGLKIQFVCSPEAEL
jgi:hypothetical protein